MLSIVWLEPNDATVLVWCVDAEPTDSELTPWCTSWHSTDCAAMAATFQDGTRIEFVSDPEQPGRIVTDVVGSVRVCSLRAVRQTSTPRAFFETRNTAGTEKSWRPGNSNFHRRFAFTGGTFDKVCNTFAVDGASNFDSAGEMDTAQVECESKTRQWLQGIKGTAAAKFKTMGEVLDGRGKHSLRAYMQNDPAWGVAEVDDTLTGMAERAAADAAVPGLGELLPEARADIQLFGDVAEPDFKDSEKRVLGMCPGAL